MDIDTPSGSSTDTAHEKVQPDDAGRLPRRSRSDRYLGGVAGGIAADFGIDPFIIRAAFLGSTLFAAYAANWGPVIPAGYTLLWLTLPGASGRSALRDVRSRPGRRESVAAVASFAVIALMLTRPMFGIALGLAALAWVLLSDQQQAEVITTTEPARSDTSTNDPSLQTPEPEWDDFDGEIGEAVKRASWGRRRRSERGEALVANFARSPRRPRREPALWPLTLSLLAVIAVGGFMADSLLQGGVDPAVLVNLALIAVGAVIVLSAWQGRALWTVLIAFALLPAWIGFSVADVGRFAGQGTTTHTPTQLPASGTLEYENGYGSLTVDLRQLPLADGDALSLDIKATAGTVTVLVPPTAETLLQSKVGLGTTTVRGNGLSYYEYDREPHMDRFMVRRYEAYGSGCIPDYWSTWWLVVANHELAGVEVAEFDVTDGDDVAPILAAISAAGLVEPQPVDDGSQLAVDYEDAAGQRYTITDEFGNEYIVADGSAYPIDEEGAEARPVELPEQRSIASVRDRTWSYSADRDGLPCVATPPSDNPATIEINATIGIGTLEVQRDE